LQKTKEKRVRRGAKKEGSSTFETDREVRRGQSLEEGNALWGADWVGEGSVSRGEIERVNSQECRRKQIEVTRQKKGMA